MLKRREFLTALGIGSLTATAWPRWVDAAPPPGGQDRLGRLLPTRPFGRADEPVTNTCLGGWHVGRYYDENSAQPIIEAALEQGIRFFDNAEQYGRGKSERFYGQHLTPKYRDEVFLMTKTGARSADEARRDLDASLQRLNTDRLDLWQIHAITSPGDVDQRIDNGVLDVVLEAKQRGKARYVGFTGHSSYKAHRRMLEQLHKRGVELDSVQMPINVLDPSYESFITHVLPEAVKRGYAVLAMKTLANGHFTDKGRAGRDEPIVPNQVSLDDALRFVWSLPVTSLVTGVDNADQLKKNCAIARRQQAMPEAERDALIQRLARYAGGEREYYKSGA